MRTPIKATAREPINRPDTYQRVRYHHLTCEGQPVHTFGAKRKAGSRPAATAKRRKRPIQFRNSLPDDISTICVTAIQARAMRELFRELIDGADVEPEYNV